MPWSEWKNFGGKKASGISTLSKGTTINCGFKPNKLIFLMTTQDSYRATLWDIDFNDSNNIAYLYTNSSPNADSLVKKTEEISSYIELTDSGFTVKGKLSSYTQYNSLWFAFS